MYIKPAFSLLLCSLILSNPSSSQIEKCKKGANNLKEYIDSGGDFRKTKQEVRFQPTIVTTEDLEREQMAKETEKEREKQSEKAQMQNRAADNYLLLMNNVMKFGFPIVTLIALMLSASLKSKQNSSTKNNYTRLFVPFVILIGMYLVHSYVNTKENEFRLTFQSTWKFGLTSVIFSIAFLFLWIKFQNEVTNLNKNQRVIILICTVVFTGSMAFFLTNNINIDYFSTPWNEGKSAFTAYPWNLLSFVILNGYLFYYLLQKEIQC